MIDIENNKPLYKIIMNDIQEMISSDKIDYDVPICTEKSLCEKYNVSRITAKRAITELEHMGVLVRKRGVGSFIARRGDEVNENISENKAFKVIALLIPFNITKGGIFRAIEAITNICPRMNYHFTFHISDLNVQRERDILKQLCTENVDGIVYYPWSSTIPIEMLNWFVERKKPVLILDKTHPYKYLSSVVCDNYAGGRMLAEHLISYGHTNICYISRFTEDELSSVKDRYAGYADYLTDNNIETPPKFVYWDTAAQEGYHLLKHIVNSLYLEGVTAIMCENDEVAFNVYMCCRSLSIRVPEEMNITGFDNIEWTTMGSAQITSVDQNFSMIGETIAEIMMKENYEAEQRVIPVKLVPRTSTGKVR